MSILTSILLDNSFKVEKKVNTNNAWGFGGAIKDVYTKDNVTVSIGKACYRHMLPSKFINICVDNKSIFDESNTSSNIKKAIDIITSLIL